MTNQSGHQEHRNDIYRARMEYAQRSVGRLALSKGEGESEGLGAKLGIPVSKPLTSILSPSRRGEAEDTGREQH